MRKKSHKLRGIVSCAVFAVAAIIGGAAYECKSDSAVAPRLENKAEEENAKASSEISMRKAPERCAERKNTQSARKIEIPAKLHATPERILKRQAYTVSFNRETNQPNWVAWCLEDYETTGTARRSDEFLADPEVPEPHQVETGDYRSSGYDRGHMAPAADMKFSAQAMKECFYMSNICPQTHELNAGAWAKLENACRRWAGKYGKVYIVCGPIFRGTKHKHIGRRLSVTVPEAFFKCIYAEPDGKPQAIGYVMNNSTAKQNMNSAAMSVDDVEKITGMDFFCNLPDKIEKQVENTFSLKNWQ